MPRKLNLKWMDLQFDAKKVRFEMGEAILVELMEDAILICGSENLESKGFELLCEAKGESLYLRSLMSPKNQM